MVIEPTLKTVKLDLGSGRWPKEGFEAVDQFSFNGAVPHVVDLSGLNWPFLSGTVSEANASHVIEHLTPLGRIHFVNELYRVLIPGGMCTVVAPHWASNRAYGDLTHQWPPISEHWFLYLNQRWRVLCAPHADSENNPDGYSCDFDVSWQAVFRDDTAVRHPEYQAFAASHYKDVIMDMSAIFTKR